MRRSDFKNAAIFTAVVLAIAAAFLIITLPPRRITLKDVPPAGAAKIGPKETVKQENTPSDSQQTYVSEKVQPGFYIVVGSFKSVAQAQQNAAELKNKFNANIIVLPPTPQGLYRISYGIYSTREEAESAIAGIRKNIGPDVWVYSVNK
jgi:cell division septation protein DedD